MPRNLGLPNPEAPLDHLDKHWHDEPPQSPWWWLILIVMTCVIVIGLTLAFVHGPTE